jgi:hypothetical protein
MLMYYISVQLISFCLLLLVLLVSSLRMVATAGHEDVLLFFLLAVLEFELRAHTC